MIEPFSFTPSEIPGLLIVKPFFATDIRGSFTKDYSKEIFDRAGVRHEVVEVFYTTSHRGVIRAMHFQRVRQQPKLVRCVHGHIFDVVADLRPDSPSFRNWLSFHLTGENRTELLVPGGCAHGYLVISDSVVSYKCAERYYPEYDDGVIWDDASLDVDWPVSLVGGTANLILSDKDRSLPSFAKFLATHGGLAS